MEWRGHWWWHWRRARLRKPSPFLWHLSLSLEAAPFLCPSPKTDKCRCIGHSEKVSFMLTLNFTSGPFRKWSHRVWGWLQVKYFHIILFCSVKLITQCSHWNWLKGLEMPKKTKKYQTNIFPRLWRGVNEPSGFLTWSPPSQSLTLMPRELVKLISAQQLETERLMALLPDSTWPDSEVSW